MRKRVRVPPAGKPSDGRPAEDTRPFCRRFSSRIEETRIGRDDHYQPRAGAFSGKVLLLIGPRNYSTSVDSVITLKNRGNVTTIGSATGGRAVSPGDSETFKGPRTGVRVTVPVGFFHPKDFERWATRQGNIAPDVAIENRPFSRADAVMEKALSLVKAAAKEPPPRKR
ncbi:MAG: hypothetical protein HY815_12815 [Candidatus Riflebacteria bacterium]|nr:hypothetical protein [Candidatus Riflebacteria bacterium]